MTVECTRYCEDDLWILGGALLADVRGPIVGAQGRSDQRPKERRGAKWRGQKQDYGPR